MSNTKNKTKTQLTSIAQLIDQKEALLVVYSHQGDEVAVERLSSEIKVLNDIWLRLDNQVNGAA